MPFLVVWYLTLDCDYSFSVNRYFDNFDFEFEALISVIGFAYQIDLRYDRVGSIIQFELQFVLQGHFSHKIVNLYFVIILPYCYLADRQKARHQCVCVCRYNNCQANITELSIDKFVD